MRTSISWCPKRSVPTNGLMSALTGLASTLFFRQRCIIVDTIIRNPTNFSPKHNYSVLQLTTPMSYNSHDPWWKHKANKLLKDVWTSQPCQIWEMISLITGKYSTVTPSIDHAKKFWWSCGQSKQQVDLQEKFQSSTTTQELGGYLWNYASLSFRRLGMAAAQIKKRWWVSGLAQRLLHGWTNHQDYCYQCWK